MRRAIMPLQAEMLGDLLMRRGAVYAVASTPLPEDAKFIGAHFAYDRDEFDLLFESKEFKDIQKGEMYPRLEPCRIKTVLKGGNIEH